jgi:multidrug resistance efflux pump
MITMSALVQELKTAQNELRDQVNGLQAAKDSLVEKLRSARRKARLNESAILRWKALAECHERAASMEASVHEEVEMTAVQSTASQLTVMDSKVRLLRLPLPARLTHIDIHRKKI